MAALTPPNVLTTPLQILQETRARFPTASGEIEFSDDHAAASTFTLQLVLPILSSPVSIGNAVDRAVFAQTLQRLFDQELIDQAIGGKAEAPVLDPRQFSMLRPLTGWQAFRRIFFECKGQKCEDVILQSLETPDGPPDRTLSSLGLAPNQLEENFCDSDYAYFKKFRTLLEQMEQPRRHSLFALFATKYPTISPRLLQEKVQRLIPAAHGGEADIHQTNLVCLKARVIGQEPAIEKMAATLTSQASLDNNQACIFVGPTGVGKTELAKAVATRKENRFVDFHMDQFQGPYDVAKLFGSAAGLVGSTDRPYFAKKVDALKPALTGETTDGKKLYEISNAVVLFDELEKAHSKVKQSLLTLFDEGTCEVFYSERSRNVVLKYVFKKCIFISTSNLYAPLITQAFQQDLPYDQIVDLFSQLNQKMPHENSFAPEFLGRLNIFPFSPIPKGECYQRLLKIKLSQYIGNIKTMLSFREVVVEHERELLGFLETKLYGEGINIRDVERYFDTLRDLIVRSKSRWPDSKLCKLIFTYGERYPCIKLSVFVERFGVYRDNACEPLLLP